MAARKRQTNSSQRPHSPAGNVMRLQKALALSGFGSRRDCEAMITEGRVEVDGEIITRLGSTADPQEQVIRVDGQKLNLPRYRYFMLNKPTGVISTASDPAGRIRVIDLIDSDQRVFNVGRLDKSSEGLILVTNDGELANHLTHPKYGVYKTYQVQVAGLPDIKQLNQLKRGIHLAEGIAKVADIRIKRTQKSTTELILVLDEGRNREIRRLLASIGHKVLQLRRIAIGPLKLGELPTGAYRELTKLEVSKLWEVAKKVKTTDGSSRRQTASKGNHKARANRSHSAPAASPGNRAKRSKPGSSNVHTKHNESRAKGPAKNSPGKFQRPTKGKSITRKPKR